MSVTEHPAARRRFQRLCERFHRLRKEHEAAVNRMWAGALATTFTDDELALLSDYLSPADQALMRKVREPKGVPPAPTLEETVEPSKV